ncbi:hypothetical protein EL22_17305 [Halostagnicola sp. A56]|nr:hypothetical protein EL22_17305 [Halostagnicola sp. A56]
MDERDDQKKRSRGDDHWLSSLLGLLDALDRSASGSGSDRRGGRFGFEYDVSIDSGLESDGYANGRPPIRSSDGSQERPGGRDAGSRSSRTRRRRPSPPPHHVSVRRFDDELVLAADISGVDPETVTVGFSGSGDDAALVVGVGDRELERVDVPWNPSAVETEARIKNGVLTVTVSSGPADTESNARSDAPGSGGDRRD